MMFSEVPEGQAARVARLRMEVAMLDYRRSLRRLRERGFARDEIARGLAIWKPADVGVIDTVGDVSMPLEGFSDATPMEICRRFAAGFIDRAQLVNELVRYPYAPPTMQDPNDDLALADPPGAWSEVSTARQQHLIPDDVYGEVFERTTGEPDGTAGG